MCLYKMDFFDRLLECYLGKDNNQNRAVNAEEQSTPAFPAMVAECDEERPTPSSR